MSIERGNRLLTRHQRLHESPRGMPPVIDRGLKGDEVVNSASTTSHALAAVVAQVAVAVAVAVRPGVRGLAAAADPSTLAMDGEREARRVAVEIEELAVDD